MTKLLCLGDSITDCGRFFSAPPLGNGYVQMLSEKLSANHKNWNIVNCGIDGFTISRLLENIDRNYLLQKPDIVSVLIGINDIGLMMNTRRTALQQKEMMQRFFQKYEMLLQRLCQSDRHIILIEPFIFSWPEEFSLWIPHVQAMSQGIEDLARKFQLPYVHLQDRLNGLAQHQGLNFVTTDGIHLTAQGHKVIADALFEILSEIS